MKYNNEVKLQQAFKIVLKEFENYKKNLADKSVLVIYKNRETSKLDYIVIEFTGNNYYHLTGLVYKEDDDEMTKTYHFGSKFYNALNDKKLSIAELKIKDNNTELKIKALPFISAQYRYSNMTGDFNESGLKLQLDKVIGNTKTCLGLKKIAYKKYAPASSLYDDTRKYAKISHQIISVFVKNTADPIPFKNIKYVAKGYELDKLLYDEEVEQLFSLEEYKMKKSSESV